MNAPAGVRVLLCVGGGIAAYKTPELVRQLVKAGHDVRVLATKAGLHFVSELSLSVVSGHPVRSRLLDPADEGTVGHIELADWAQLVIVAPATANLIARAALGLADDLVTTVLLATRAPVLWAPAMNTNMWQHEAVVANVATLRGRGHSIVGPDAGQLACGWEGEGKMSDPMTIVARAIEQLTARETPGNRAWHGRRVVVSAGPTRTYLDPVRFISNASSGVMGFALAASFADRGADVVLVAGPVAIPTPARVQRIDVETATQMHAALERELEAGDIDVLCMVAAVSDLRLARPNREKLGKEEFIHGLGDLPWAAETDLVADLAQRYRPRTRFLAFAAETAPGDDAAADATILANARRKLDSKRTDAIFVNRVGTTTTGMGVPTNAGTLVFARDDSALRDPDPTADKYPDVVSSGAPVAKRQLADWIVAHLERRWLCDL